MAFHPRYFDEPIKNSSSGYDYDEWNRTGRQQAAQQVTKETREAAEARGGARARRPTSGSSRRSAACSIFSAAQLHSTVPNTTDRTRFSIDFRTVNLDDLVEGVGRAERRLGVHGHDARRLPARERPRAAAGGADRQLSRGCASNDDLVGVSGLSAALSLARS